MRLLTAAFILGLLAVTPAMAAEKDNNDNGFGTEYFTNNGHPGFSDPATAEMNAEDMSSIEPGAGEPETEAENPAAEKSDSAPATKPAATTPETVEEISL